MRYLRYWSKFLNEVLKSEFERILFDNPLPIDVLVGLVNKWKALGVGQRDIFERFDEFRAYLRTEGRRVDEDNIVDVMDMITGFCSDHQRLFGVYSADLRAGHYQD